MRLLCYEVEWKFTMWDVQLTAQNVRRGTRVCKFANRIDEHMQHMEAHLLRLLTMQVAVNMQLPDL